MLVSQFNCECMWTVPDDLYQKQNEDREDLGVTRMTGNG